MFLFFFYFFFFFNDTATTEIYTLSLHDALPILAALDHLTDQGDHQDDDEQQHRGGRGGTDPVVGESRVGDQQQQDPGGLTWSAFGHQEHLVEDLETGDDLQQHNERGGAAQQRDRDRADLLPLRRAVNRRRLVQLARDVLQSGEVKDEVESDRPPQGGHGDPDHGQRRAGQHGRRLGDTEQALEGVPQPTLGRVDKRPDQRDRCRRQDEGEEEGEPEESLSATDPVRQNGEHEGQDHQRWHRVERELDRVPQRRPELRRGEHLPVVFEADEVAEPASDQGCVVKTADEHVDDRPDQEQQVEQAEGSDEQPGRGRSMWLAAGSAWSCGDSLGLDKGLGGHGRSF